MMDLFEAAEDREPKFCGTCGFFCETMDKRGFYCDLSKRDTTLETPACDWHARRH